MARLNVGFPPASAGRACLAAASSKADPRPLLDAVTSERIYSDDEAEFLRAIAAYQARHGVRYPTWSETLHVLKSLGYRKAAPA